MTQTTIRLTLSYHGGCFHGWQRQKGSPSVQQALEEAVARLTGAPATVYGCGRTDSGAHALAYTAHFRTGTRIPPERFARALNGLLPPAILVLDSRAETPEFHSRYDALGKCYRYLIADRASPLLNGLAACSAARLNLAPMRAAARTLIGRHDFAAFQSAGSPRSSTVRTVRAIRVSRARFSLDPRVTMWVFEIEADGFLYRMARNIAGTLAAVGRGELPRTAAAKLLAGRDRTRAPAPLPACGLYLTEVFYPEHPSARHRTP